MRNHQVRFVEDDALPDGSDWALAQCGDFNVLFIRESADVGLVMCEFWTVFHRSMAVVPSPRPPGHYPAARGRRVVLSGIGAALAAAGVAASLSGGLSAMEGFPLWSATGAAVTSQWLQLLQL